ncbi:MAG: ABC transporter substrate-binding protein [Spirochaetales bacterium]|jgi:peptide/nickel transport system substrate-binding protein|nr:ABC transporter substrate-binding protein [Spirochaetales bacterium]
MLKRFTFFVWIFPCILAACSDPPPLTPGAAGNSSGRGGVVTADNIPGTRRVEKPLRWETGKPGGTWYDTYLEDPKSYNYFSNLDGSHLTVTSFMLDYLFDYDTDKREWSGRIIESFEVVADEARDTMELRCRLRNISWSDGVQMTADDMIFWYDEICGDKDIYPLGYQGQFVNMDNGSRERILMKKTGPLSFTYIFPRVVQNPCLMVNSGSMVPRHIWEPAKKKGKEAVMELWSLDTPPEDLVGNGPFLLERYVPGERLIFKKNPRYWMRDEAGNPLPYIDRIILTRTPDPNAELLKFQKGEVESYGLRGKDIATLLPEAEKNGYSIWNGGPSGSYNLLMFNQNPAKIGEVKHAWFTNPDFRKAVSCLVDREAIVNLVLNGLGSPLYHIISESNYFYNPDLASPCAYDPAQAKDYLARGGFHWSQTGECLDAQGNPVTFDVMTGSKDPSVYDYLNIIIQDMQELGIKATLQVVDPNAYSDKLLNTYEWYCTLMSFGFPIFPEQWYNVWLSDGNRHYWHPKQAEASQDWENRIDILYRQLVHTYNENTVRTLYNEFQEILIGNMVIIPLVRSYTFMAVYDRWANVNWDVRHTIGDDYIRIFLRE